MYNDGERKPDDDAGPPQARDDVEDQGQGSNQAPTPQYDNGLFHLHGHYMDDACGMMMNMDLRAEIRHQHPYPMAYPDHYHNDWALPTPWDMRYTTYEQSRRANQEGDNNEGGDQ